MVDHSKVDHLRGFWLTLGGLIGQCPMDIIVALQIVQLVSVTANINQLMMQSNFVRVCCSEN